jgi:hypothetical protein
MNSARSLFGPIALAAGATLLIGGNLPQAMLAPGQWQIDRGGSAGSESVCLADAAMLMQWEHRRKQCERTIVASTIDSAEVHYTCAGGGFGSSRVEVLTPRSITVKTQGIADGQPFGYVIHARRIGICESH